MYKKGGIKLTIGNRIKTLRKALNLSQVAFGKNLGVSRDVINNAELERATISQLFIKAISSEYNINEEWLISGKGKMFKETNESLLDKLKNKYDLSNLEFILLKEYLKLDKKQRQVFENYFDNVIKAQSDGEIINTENEVNKFIDEIPSNPEDFENSHIIEPEKTKGIKEFKQKLTENEYNVNKDNNDINKKSY